MVFIMGRNDSLIEVHLPFNQHSKLPVRKGVTLRDAIGNILKKRNIDPKMCRVCTSEDPRSVRLDLRVDLETLVKKLDKKELWVHSEGLQLMSSIQHDFKKVNLGKCNVCGGMMLISGYRCERCFFNFHGKCWSQIPLYCDLTEQIPHNPVMADQLREICDKYGGRSADLATAILDTLRSDTAPPPPTTPSPVQSEEPRGGEITRQSAVRRHDTSAHQSPYSRDRASSAPNINAIKDDFVQTGNMQTSSIHSGMQRFLTTTSESPSNETPVLSPQSDQPSSSQLLTPSGHHSVPKPLLSPMSLPSNGLGTSTNLTPPQSAPPQKVTQEFFPRGRSGGNNYKRQSVGDWEIGHNDIQFGSKIGSGSFGTVYKARYFGDVAVKVLNVENPGQALLKAFRNEMALLRTTRHTNILNFMGWVREPQLAIVTQWCQGSSLYHHIHVVEPKTEFSLAMIIKICRQIVHGMCYLHNRNIIHRDLKTNNIFLTEDNTVKIGDFGLATVKTKFNAGQQTQQPTGSILWMAPEVIRMREHTTRSDVYSFGVCLYELLTSRLPYDHINNRDQIIFMVGAGYVRPDASHLRIDTPQKLRDIFLKCVSYEPENRVEFNTVKLWLDRVAQTLPKLTKSQSDSFIYKAHKSGDYNTHANTDELDSSLHSNVPRTPKFASPGPFSGED